MGDCRKILLLSANPKETEPLRLGEEMREIEAGLRRAKQRDQFTMELATALRYRDLRRVILDHEPHIVHFSGHGEGRTGLIFEDEAGQASFVTGEALSGLFALVADRVECVLLNACYSQVQAAAIAQHIPYVVGMNQAIGDRAAIEFAVGFYDALGAGQSYEMAYKYGCNGIQLAGIPEQHTPVWFGPSPTDPSPTDSPPTESSPTDQPRLQRILIRYQDQEPESNLAQAFYDHLATVGQAPVLAAAGLTWDNWVSQIDQELRCCDYLLLLLSEAWAVSDRVAGEVQTARQLWEQGGKPIILPIRINLPQNYPFHGELWRALQGMAQFHWRSPVDTPRLVQDLSGLIVKRGVPEASVPDSLPDPKPQSPPAESHPPLPIANLELPGGTMPLNSEFYIRREPWDRRCLQEIEHQAGLVRIKAPQQMGKTSLLARIRDRAAQLGYHPVTISFLETDERAFTDATVFLQRLCATISKQLDLSPRRVLEDWDEALFGPKENCSDYVEKVLGSLDAPLFLGLDELDRLFPYEGVSKEFLTLLRSWNEKGKVNPTWAKLRMAIAHSTESYVVLDTNVSPFNVGLAVDLPEFRPGQVLALVQKHGLAWGAGEVEALMGMVGGHAYLVRLALYHLAKGDVTLGKLLQEAPTDTGIYGEHLRQHLWNLQQHPDLAAAFEQVILTDRPVELRPILAFKLNGMGLANLQGNGVVLRYDRLYRPYFRARFRSLA
jgi:hypothetical protein